MNLRLISSSSLNKNLRKNIFQCPCGLGFIEEDDDYTPGHRDCFASLHCKKCEKDFFIKSIFYLILIKNFSIKYFLYLLYLIKYLHSSLVLLSTYFYIHIAYTLILISEMHYIISKNLHTLQIHLFL